MTTVARAEVPRSRIAVASFIGTAIEFYDFYIYGTALFYTVTTFCLSLGTSSLHIPRTTMLVAALVAAAVMGVATLGFAMCSDRWGRRRLSAVAAGLAAVWAFPLFALLQTRNPVLVTIALVGGLFCFAMLYGPMGAFLPELFRVRYRYSGASVAYSASGVV
ncbi:MAG TPA: MFS transporter, partial [Pseudonocardia sp.]|nr:MFS transporter [Pseudonocardia sp.]